MLLSGGSVTLLLLILVQDLLLNHLFNIFNAIVILSVNLVVKDELQEFEELNARFAQGSRRHLSQKDVEQQIQVIKIEVVGGELGLLQHYLQCLAALVHAVLSSTISQVDELLAIQRFLFNELFENWIFVDALWIWVLLFEDRHEAHQDGHHLIQCRIVLDILQTAIDFVQECLRDMLRGRIFIENINEQNEGITCHVLQLRLLHILYECHRELEIVKELLADLLRKALVQLLEHFKDGVTHLRVLVVVDEEGDQSINKCKFGRTDLAEPSTNLLFLAWVHILVFVFHQGLINILYLAIHLFNLKLLKITKL